MALNVTIFPQGSPLTLDPLFVFDDSVSSGMVVVMLEADRINFSSVTQSDTVEISTTGLVSKGLAITNATSGVWAGETLMINTIGESRYYGT